LTGLARTYRTSFLELAILLGYKAAIPVEAVEIADLFAWSIVFHPLMKILYLLRHAKSSWDDPELKDFERPLASRGIDDVPVMAARFQGRGGQLACIICSPANRAKSTARLFAKNIEFDVDDIISNPELYFAGTPMFLKAASHVDETCDSAMLVGHNPAITEFANAMANCDIDNIPTCGLVEMRLPIEHWNDIDTGTADLLEFDYPKKST